MLSEVLEAWAPQIQKTRTPRVPGLSMSSLFPCPYRLYLVHTGEYTRQRGVWTPQQILNADDGWYQESQSIERLARAGVKIIDRQKRVVVGKSKVPGTMDGAFVLDGVRRVWEHKAYGDNSEALWTLLTRGFDSLPSQKAQISGYMLGDGSEEGCFFVKLKSSNTYVDRLVKLDRPFIEEILEWCDKIRLEGWKPEPTECKWCTSCGVGCFDEAMDFSWIQSADSSEMVEKWKKGKQFIGIGNMLQEEADSVFLGVKNKAGKVVVPGLIGDKDLLVLPGLEIKKTIVHRFDVDKQLVLQEFGPEGLIKVGREKDVVQYRHKET